MVLLHFDAVDFPSQKLGSLHVQYGIWVKVAQTNHLELQQIPQERMNRKSQPAPEIILKYHHFIDMRRWEGLTEGRPPSGGSTVRKNTSLHQSVKLRLSRSRWHPLFVTPSFGARLLGARLLRFGSSLLWRHLSDLIRVWWQKQVWMRI